VPLFVFSGFSLCVEGITGCLVTKEFYPWRGYFPWVFIGFKNAVIIKSYYHIEYEKNNEGLQMTSG
jgi:hypothetical protein